MSRKRLRGLTMDEILGMLEDQDKNENGNESLGDIIIVPPDVDALSDEDIGDDEETGEMLIKDVPGSLELHIENNFEDESAPLDENTLKIQKPSKKSRGKKRKLCESIPNWENIEPTYTKNKERGSKHRTYLQEMKDALELLTPVEIFEELISPEIYDHIIKETVRYAIVCKNVMDFVFSVDELKVFIGILLLSSYHKLPSERHFWSNDEDLGISIVKDAMSRNRFQTLKTLIHLNDNEEAENNKNDRGFKIRPLITMVQKSFLKFGIFEEFLAVDEMIVRYYGHNSLKQFIRGKPVRFGYKFWALCGVSGYCYNFDLYCGKASNDEGYDDLLLGSKVVLKMLTAVNDPCSYTIFFDNLFTDYALLVHLRNLGFQATGTMRENRLGHCPLKDAKQMKKKQRGTHLSRFDSKEEILIVKWLDNKCVIVGTNYDTVLPLKNVQRWQKDKKCKGNVPQPNVLSSYNKYMGGVDKHDWLAGKYSISIRGKKWYWPLIMRILDMAIVNAWTIYKHVNEDENKIMRLLDFKREVCLSYIKGAADRLSMGRKKSQAPARVISNIRFDHKDHFLRKRDKQRRCQNKPCTAKPKTYCEKCMATLCFNCFFPYHSKNN